MIRSLQNRALSKYSDAHIYLYHGTLSISKVAVRFRGHMDLRACQRRKRRDDAKSE